MVDYPGGLITLPKECGAPLGGVPGGICSLAGGSTGTIHMYQMCGKDVDMLPSIVYRTWVVTGSPDFTAALYTGPKGGPTPLADITATTVS